MKPCLIAEHGCRGTTGARPAGAWIEPGAVEAQLAARAMRRIRGYLTQHPNEEAISVGREAGSDDALIVPRAVVDLMAFVLRRQQAAAV